MTLEEYADLQFCVRLARDEQIRSVDKLKQRLIENGMDEFRASDAILTWAQSLQN